MLWCVCEMLINRIVLELELVNDNSLPNSCCGLLQYRSLALFASWKANRRVNTELLSKPETKFCHDLEQCCTQMDCLCRYMMIHVVTDATILLTGLPLVDQRSIHCPKSSCHALLPAFERHEATTQMIASIVMYSTSEREILSYK